MLTKEEKAKLMEQLKTLKKEQASLKESKTVDKNKVIDPTEKASLMERFKRIQDTQISLQRKVVKLNKNKKLSEGVKKVETKKEAFDPDLVECIKRRDTWDKLVENYIKLAENDIVNGQDKNVIPGNAVEQSGQPDSIYKQGTEQNTAQTDATVQGAEQVTDVQSGVEDAGGNYGEQLKAINKKILQLKQFIDSITPDQLKDVETEQSKLQTQIQDEPTEQQGTEQQVGDQSVQDVEAEMNNMQNKEEGQIDFSDIQEAISRRNFWNDTIQRLIMSENREEENKEAAIAAINPSDDVKKQLTNLKDQIDTMIQSNDFIKNQTEEKKGIEKSPIEDQKVEESYKKTIAMQMEQIKNLKEELAKITTKK